ncbi:hypothetical protein [Stieleria varia]|uniref:Neutral/alkaline non-lysosomal ceramidase n=1 Tax=Stieleria varia TaxID=2528005 RepID=A0A5C6B7E8_9BACT|nr:hypothetical protein [Stieleria varia]TWU07983.1 hypothetical protein Pla52n_05600 [Stieleria varia]
MKFRRIVLATLALLIVWSPGDGFTAEPAVADTSSSLSIATFDLDVTPPVGNEMAYDPVRRLDELTLRCRGIVVSGAGQPIVLCAVDWIGIANEAHDAFRNRIAKAAGTTPERVSVHCLHQHDAPRCDFSAEQIIHHAGATDLGPFNGGFARQVLDELGQVVAAAVTKPRQITHAGYGVADVKDVASNRRLLDADGKVYATRYTTCRDPALRAVPDGTIDPQLSCLVFYDNATPVASLTYYACHPQSYYRTGVPSPDFPGIARFFRGQDTPEVMHVHFNGAGGNIGAGKYNDGNKENRLILARRVAEAMQTAFDSAKRFPITAKDVQWKVRPVALPPAPHLDREQLQAGLANVSRVGPDGGGADDLAWLMRCQSGHKIDIGCLAIGDVRVLHLPGELFVEYQLAAKAMRDDLNVMMAAYGDYGPGYIGTEIAYGQGGYETSERASRVDKSSEGVLMGAIAELLEGEAPEAGL